MHSNIPVYLYQLTRKQMKGGREKVKINNREINTWKENF